MSGQELLLLVVAVLTSSSTCIWRSLATTSTNHTRTSTFSCDLQRRASPSQTSDPDASTSKYYSLQEEDLLPRSSDEDSFTTKYDLQEESSPSSSYDSSLLITTHCTTTLHTDDFLPPDHISNTSATTYDIHKDNPLAYDYDRRDRVKEHCHRPTWATLWSSLEGPRGILKDTLISQRLPYTEMLTLREMLEAVVQQEMKECHLVVGYGNGYIDPAVLDQLLLLLPNLRQVVHVNAVDDLLGVVWESSSCRGYLFLLDNPTTLLNYTNREDDLWHYHGKFVFVGLSVEQLEVLTVTKKGKKTEHIVGAVQSGVQGEWRLYMNQLYWGEGIQHVATWRHNRFTSQVDLFPDKVSDLRGVVLKVVTFVWEPSVFYYRAPNGSLLFHYGMDVDIVRTIASVLNFALEFEEPPNDELWGLQIDNGSYTGLLGKLNRDEVDIGIGILYVSHARLNVIDYSSPFDIETSCFLIRSESPLAKWQALAFPFQLWTWLAILACLIISGPVLFLLALGSGHCGEERRNLQTLSFSWYYAFGLHFCEPQMCLPRMASTQVFIMFLWVYTMILTIAYSTNLTAFMVVSKQPATIDTIKDLHGSSLKVAGIGDFYEHQLISASDPYLQRLGSTYEGYTVPEEIFPLVLEGKAVFLQNRGFHEFVAATRFGSRGASSVRLMKECFAPYNIAMGLQRHSPLKRKVDQVIGWVQQSGLIRHFFLDSLRLAASTEEYGGGEGKVVQAQQEAGVVVPLTLDHLQGIFLVLVLGWFSSFIVFVLEKTVLSRCL